MATTYFRYNASGNVFTTDSARFWNTDTSVTRLSATEGKAALREQTLATLRGILQSGDTVYCVLHHVSASGMSRRIDFYAMQDNKPRYLSGYIEDVLSYKRHPHKSGLVVGGCGMDMGFSVVYNLGAVMWPNGTCVPHGTRNGEADSDGGYALKSEWL